jgi:hypothetical protein
MLLLVGRGLSRFSGRFDRLARSVRAWRRYKDQTCDQADRQSVMRIGCCVDVGHIARLEQGAVATGMRLKGLRLSITSETRDRHDVTLNHLEARMQEGMACKRIRGPLRLPRDVNKSTWMHRKWP